MSSEAQYAHVPLDVLQKLVPEAEKLGLNIPGVARFAPSIDLTEPIRKIALDLGRLVAPRDIFLDSTGAVVTVDPASGEKRVMTARRFPDWCEEWCAFRAPGARRARESMSVEDAAQILETDTFRRCLRPLRGVHLMRLPVRRRTGDYVFLDPGYDVESAIYTVETVSYAEDWTIEQAREWLADVCHEFPWNGLEDVSVTERMAAIGQNRSFSVHVAAIVSTFCASMFPEGTLRPMIGYFANKPGSGKTRLAEMALSPVFGFVGGTAAPKDEEKMDLKLETIARSMAPWVIFDDVGGRLHSNALNKFLTEARHTGRAYYSNSEFFNVPHVTQVIVTANELGTSEDLGRRVLVAEFFLADEVRGRKFKRTITSNWLVSQEVRGKFLSAACAIVRHWLADAEANGEPFFHPTPLETFEDWSRVIGGMVVAAGFADPLAKPEMDVGGATVENEIRQLLVLLASGQDADCVLTREDIVFAAREAGLLEDLVGAKGADCMDATATKRFGRRMQRWRGQRLKDDRGRTFVFSHKKRKTGATYPLQFL